MEKINVTIYKDDKVVLNKDFSKYPEPKMIVCYKFEGVTVEIKLKV